MESWDGTIYYIYANRRGDTMLNIGQLAAAVQQNCNISDARHAGDFTLCVFLLKMREYYRWENDIPFNRMLPKEDVGAWLEERERLWDGLESSQFQPLPLAGSSADPFDTARINGELIPQGYVYSGGYGRFNKPHFFLGELARRDRHDGFNVLVSNCEYARDLEAPPAMLQGHDIYVRQESVRRYVWEKIEESRWSPNNTAMQRALAAYNFERDADAALERMAANETETMILHEIGEGKAGELLGPDWSRMLAALSRSRAEIIARAVRDLLADCLSTWPRLIADDNKPALHFYFATFSGMRRQLYPEAVAAYRAWAEDGVNARLHELVAGGAERWQRQAQQMLDAYRRDPARVACAIDQLTDSSSS